MQKEKVAIIAMGPSRALAPYEDPSFDFWGLNAFHRVEPAVVGFFTAWFQIHQPGSDEGHIDDPDHIMWLKEVHHFPIYMVEKFDEYPSSVAYPFDDAVKELGPLDPKGAARPYFTNSVDYMVALAIMQNYKEIRMFGTDFVADGDDDYLKRRQSLEYYCGIARGRGIKVVIPRTCALLKAEYVYGFQPKLRDNDDTIKELLGMRDRIEEGRQKSSIDYMNSKAAVDKADGAIRILDEVVFQLRHRKRGLPF